MRAVESDIVKPARKAKDKCTRPVKERQKLVSKLCIGRRMASMRESRETVIDSSQHTSSTLTCTAAPRVWHFSAFHCLCSQQYSILNTAENINITSSITS